MKARLRLAVVVLIVLAASILRSYRLADIPPGVEHDEVAEWQIARGILAGHHAIFFREAYGQEPAYLYLQAASISLFGDNVFALRFTSFAIAMLTLAMCYRSMRRLFGSVAALVSLAFLAVTLWPLFFARVAIRGMMLPLVMCVGADTVLSNFKSKVSKPAIRQFAIAGLWFGLAAYTYLAARAIPILLLGFMVCMALFAREQIRNTCGLVITLLIAALVAAPLAIYLWRSPDVQFRVDEVSGPLKQLQKGDASAVLAGVRDTALMFSVRGDQTVRDNWPYRPVFVEPLSAALFYVGLAAALWHWRKPEYAFTLMWLVALLLPTMVTAAPPNFVRALGALPPIFALPGIGAAALFNRIQGIHRRGAESAEKTYRILFGLGVSAVIVLNLVLTVHDYFIRWPAHPETQFVWQMDLASIANHLDSALNVLPDVAISGLSNETMDDSSLRLLTKRHDLAVRWFDSRTTLVIPFKGGHMFIPHTVPLDELLHTWLVAWGAKEHDDPAERFRWYDVTNVRLARLEHGVTTPAGIFVSAPISLDNHMIFLGYVAPTLSVTPGADMVVMSCWQAVSPQPPLKDFVHLTDASGKIIAQSDGLNAPPQFWQTGDVVIRLHRFRVPPDTALGVYRLNVGLYDSQTGVRVQFRDAGDHLRLPDVEVKP